MKALNKISQILAIVFGVGSLVLFFMPFVNITTNGLTVSPVAAQLAWGSNVEVGKSVANMATSGHILFVFCLTAIGMLMSIFAFKAKGLRYSSSIFALISAVYMWVIALKSAQNIVDVRPLSNITKIEYTSFVIYLAIAILCFAIFAIAYLFIDDYIEAKASKDKKTICQRVALFFRDNKSEIKKIVWPGPRDVVKNTITVLVMCLIIGALIWVVDFGLGKLLELIADVMSKKGA